MSSKALGNRNFLCLVLTLVLQICSIRPIFKYIPYTPYSYILILIGSAIFYYFLIYYLYQKTSVLKSPLLTFVLTAFIVVVNFFMYPKADALKHQGRGSDADDAVIVATTRLFHGQYPYDEKTYLNNKMSPGLGILVFMSPFVLTNSYFLAIPFYVLLFALLCRKIFNSYEVSNLVLLMLISCFGFWEYMIIGSDLVVIGSLIAILNYFSLKNYDNLRLVLVFAILTGILMTSRITLIYLIPVLAVILFKRHKIAGVVFGICGIVTCMSIHAFFYYWQPENYAPLHLLSKGQRTSNVYVLIIGAVCNLSLLFFFLKEKSLDRISSFKYAWLFNAIPHLFIGISMIIADRFLMWFSEGPGYLIIQIFSFLLLYFFMIEGSKQVSVPENKFSLVNAST